MEIFSELLRRQQKVPLKIKECIVSTSKEDKPGTVISGRNINKHTELAAQTEHCLYFSLKSSTIHLFVNIHLGKVIRQGKLIAFAYSLRTY